MYQLLFLPFKTVSLVGVGVGVLTAVAAKKYARPLAVETLRLGFQVKDGTEKVWSEAREAASGMAEEAKTSSGTASKSRSTSAAA